MQSEDRPVHQPAAPDAPIPGRQWYSGCDPDMAYVDESGICQGCGEVACAECGAEFYPDGGCQCPPGQHASICPICHVPIHLSYGERDTLASALAIEEHLRTKHPVRMWILLRTKWVWPVHLLARSFKPW